MIIGNGDIASVLHDRADLLFFASGVSNSQETNEGAYQREIDLLMEQSVGAHIVYFSSLAVFYSMNRYSAHKQEMEVLVRERFVNHTIVRLGNITWGNNPHTLINHFRNQVKQGETPEIRDEWRYIVDLDEFLHWMNLIPPWNCELNIPGKRMKVQKVFDEYT